MSSTSARPSVDALVTMMKIEASKKSAKRRPPTQSNGEKRRKQDSTPSLTRPSSLSSLPSASTVSAPSASTLAQLAHSKPFNAHMAALAAIQASRQMQPSAILVASAAAQSGPSSLPSATPTLAHQASAPKVRPHYARKVNGAVINLSNRTIILPRWVRNNAPADSQEPSPPQRSSFYAQRTYPVTLLSSLHRDTIDLEIEKYEVALFEKRVLPSRQHLATTVKVSSSGSGGGVKREGGAKRSATPVQATTATIRGATPVQSASAALVSGSR